MKKPIVSTINYSKITNIIDDAEPGREVDYLISEINNKIGFIRLDQIDNWYVQRMIHNVENLIESLEYLLERREVNG